MFNVLITGEHSFIGNSLKDWLEKSPDKYSVTCINIRDEIWKKKSFTSFDVVVHTAGIVHRKATTKNHHLYSEVNRDLTYELAKKAKKEGISHFLYLSSMSVYGLEKGVVSRYTPLKPVSVYGKSKLQAENLLTSLSDETFALAIIRPPMVYGKDCSGNYPKLSKIAFKSPVFPMVSNERSMLYIDNLSSVLQKIIDEKSTGVFCPQNTHYINTSQMVQQIARAHGHKIILVKGFGRVLNKMPVQLTTKLFGNLIYDKELSLNCDISPVSFEESINITEK